MAEAVFGNDVILSVKVSGDYKPVLCATDCVFNRTPEIVETTSPDSGIFKEFIIRREEWDMSVSGLTRIANAAALTFFYKLQTSVRRILQDIKISFTDVDGASVYIYGQALIGNESISGPASDFSQCSISFKGSGPFTVSDVDPPNPAEVDVYSDYWATKTDLVMLIYRLQVWGFRLRLLPMAGRLILAPQIRFWRWIWRE